MDLGAYEFQGTGLSSFTGWLWQYGLRTGGSSDYADTDADGLNNWQEWQADTNPTNTLSVLRIESISNGPPVTVQFLSSPNRLYTLRYATNLTAAPWTDVPGQTEVPGRDGWLTLSDTNAAPARFYRVSVRMPPCCIPVTCTPTNIRCSIQSLVDFLLEFDEFVRFFHELMLTIQSDAPFLKSRPQSQIPAAFGPNWATAAPWRLNPKTRLSRLPSVRALL